MKDMKQIHIDKTKGVEKMIEKVSEMKPDFADQLSVKDGKLIYTDKLGTQHAYDISTHTWDDNGKPRRGIVSQFIGWASKKHDKI